MLEKTVRIITFRTGHADTKLLTDEFTNTFIILCMLENGFIPTPFSAETLPGLDNRQARRHKLVQRSPERFAESRSKVESKMKRWLGYSN